MTSETLVAEPAADAESGQRARRLARREFRPRRAAAGLCAALLLALAGGVAAIEVVSVLIGDPAGLVPADRWAAWLHRTSWNDPRVLAAASGVTAAGLALLLSLLPARRPRMIPLHGADPYLAAAISRRTLQRSLVSAGLSVPGIVKVRVRVRGGRFRRRVTVRAVTRYRNPANLTDLVRGALAARLSEMDLMDPRRVRVRLSWRKD
ncbi:DUF6286 domain-containing protein [Spirillospora sp. NPDC029432]|uniref:DUF6286 domain-containing protein n=1 Tax=Spirillospora sp. NPDC029432 TaxID=3154599 RepID=UPI0034551AE2